MNIKHFNIPIFIPGLACPFGCIFCEQHKITGKCNPPHAKEVIALIENHLLTIPRENSETEIAFFGGSFTGLPFERQDVFLGIAASYIASGRISGIRLSTRPDMISKEVIAFLKRYPVTAIELGAQSMDNEVLRLAGRGHDAAATERASGLIKKAGYLLGLQMMIGLPGDSPDKSMDTAGRIAELGADQTRIYPTVVIKDTPLATLFRKGEFKPLSLNSAVEWTASLYRFFEQHGVKVLRMGLHPSEGLLSGEDLIAGPFSPAFGHLVHTRLWEEELQPLFLLKENQKINISVASSQISYAIGHRASNRKRLLQKFRQVTFCGDTTLTGRKFNYVFSE